MSHRIPLAKLKRLSDNRWNELAARLGGEAGGARNGSHRSLAQQLNEVLQTTDTPRGLVVNMADVLFQTGK